MLFEFKIFTNLLNNQANNNNVDIKINKNQVLT